MDGKADYSWMSQKHLYLHQWVFFEAAEDWAYRTRIGAPWLW